MLIERGFNSNSNMYLYKKYKEIHVHTHKFTNLFNVNINIIISIVFRAHKPHRRQDNRGVKKKQHFVSISAIN